MAYSRFIAKPFLFAALSLMAGLVVPSNLKLLPLQTLRYFYGQFYKPSDILLAGVPGHEPRFFLGLPETADLNSSEFTPTNVVADSQGPLQEAIFFALLIGSILRYLMSVRSVDSSRTPSIH